MSSTGVPAAVRAGCGEPAATADSAEGRKYLLERIDDVAVVQLYVDGFEQLPLDQKTLIYHLSQAAIAGRDVFIDQKYKHSMAVRDLVEEVLTHSEGIEADTLDEIRRYTKLFWINNGLHNPVTSRKNTLKCTFEEFADAVKKAEASGAKLPLRKGETTDDLLARMKPILFDPEVDSHVTNKSPGRSKTSRFPIQWTSKHKCSNGPNAGTTVGERRRTRFWGQAYRIQFSRPID